MSEPSDGIAGTYRLYPSRHGGGQACSFLRTQPLDRVFDLRPGRLDRAQVRTVPGQRQKPRPRRFDHAENSALANALHAVDVRVVLDDNVALVQIGHQVLTHEASEDPAFDVRDAACHYALAADVQPADQARLARRPVGRCVVAALSAWLYLPDLLGDVEVLDTFANEELSAVTVEFSVEFHCGIIAPSCTLRIVDQLRVNAEGEIIEQENFFDPRDLTNPGGNR